MENTQEQKRNKLFIILAGIFITNALLAEMIGVKIFSAESTLGLQPAHINILGFTMDFNRLNQISFKQASSQFKLTRSQTSKDLMLIDCRTLITDERVILNDFTFYKLCQDACHSIKGCSHRIFVNLNDGSRYPHI